MLNIIKSSKHDNYDPEMIVGGRGLKRRVKAMDPTRRRIFGADLVLGVVQLRSCSLGQAAYLAETTVTEIRAELQARAADLEASYHQEARTTPEIIAHYWQNATKEEKEQDRTRSAVADPLRATSERQADARPSERMDDRLAARIAQMGPANEVGGKRHAGELLEGLWRTAGAQARRRSR